MPPPERYEPFAVDEVMSATIAEPAAVVKFQDVALPMPAKLSARTSRIAPESSRTCIAVLPGKIAVGLIVTVNGAAPEYATLELSSVGIASITRSAVAPAAAALLPRFVTPATFDALDAAAFVKFIENVFVSAAVTTNAPLLSFCVKPSTKTTSPARKPWEFEVRVAMLLEIAMLLIVLADSASSTTERYFNGAIAPPVDVDDSLVQLTAYEIFRPATPVTR